MRKAGKTTLITHKNTSTSMNEKFKIRNLTFQNRYCPSSCFLGVFRNCIINKRINVNIWQIIKLWVNQNHGAMCCFEKLSIPSTLKGFFLRPPHPSGNFSQASYIYLDFWAFENPPPPRTFQSLPREEYGYFQELHSDSGVLNLHHDNHVKVVVLLQPSIT